MEVCDEDGACGSSVKENIMTDNLSKPPQTLATCSYDSVETSSSSFQSLEWKSSNIDENLAISLDIKPELTKPLIEKDDRLTSIKMKVPEDQGRSKVDGSEVSIKENDKRPKPVPSIEPAMSDLSRQSLPNQNLAQSQNIHVQPKSSAFPAQAQSSDQSQGDVEKDNSGISTSLSPLSSIFFEQFTEKRQRVKFEGRIIEMPIDWFEDAIKRSKRLAVGGYGEVFVVKEKTEMPFVIKKIACKGDADKQKSAACEMLAARLMHFAIVPVLAMTEDVRVSRDYTYYFMLPYLENGSLADKLRYDGKQIEESQNPKIELDKEKRMQILLQIACAMEFLHRKVKDFRSSYVHRDITSGNIVLDRNYNARLLDFGLAREYTPGKEGVTVKQTDLMGTPGYYRTINKTKMTVSTDCNNFGVVILETLASKPPMDADGQKKLVPEHFDHFCDDHDENISAVWKSKSLQESLIKLSEKCWNQDIKAETIRKELQEIIEEKGINFWNEDEQSQNDEERNCEICMINPVTIDARSVLNHTNKCHLYVCVACMRNSYLNPIQCHSCMEDVIPPIGHQWAALLIAGNDCEEKEVAELFRQDMDLIYKAITSHHPLTMGISKELVYCVCPKVPGKGETLLPQLEKTMKCLADHKPKTLLVYFNGHHSKELGFNMGHKDEYLKTSELKTHIQQVVEASKCTQKVIVLLDCCQAQAMKLDLSVAFCQINSCGPSQNTGLPQGIGSLFTNFLLDALKGKSSQQKCFLARQYDLAKCQICLKYNKSDDGFIMIHKNLPEFIRLHVEEYDKKWGNEGGHEINVMNFGTSKDFTFGYFIDSPVKFDFWLEFPGNGKKIKHELSQLPETYGELMAELFKSFTEKFHLDWLSTTDFADILAVMVSYGPKAVHKYERNKLFQLEAAWNGKQKLCVCPRKLEQLHDGPVGVFMKKGSALEILKILTHDDMNSLCEHSKLEQQDNVLVSLGNQGAWTLWKLVKDKKGAEDMCRRSHRELFSYLKTIKDNKSLQQKGKLVFKFPHVQGASGQKFFAVYTEQTRALTEEGTNTERDEDSKPLSSDNDVEDETPSFKSKLRNYQLELAEKALSQKNTVVCAPTGTGKTWVALYIIEEHLKLAKPGKVVFTAKTGALIQQQYDMITKYLPQFKTKLLQGDGNESRMLGDFLLHYEIFCFTPQVLVNNLESGSVASISQFSLIIFDECHHTKKDSPYSNLMRMYLLEKFNNKNKLPQIVGLTATLGVGKSSNEIEALDYIYHLLALLDVKELSTVKLNKEEMLKEASEPAEETIQMQERQNDVGRRILNKAIKDTEELLEEMALMQPSLVDLMMKECPQNKESQAYNNWTHTIMNAALAKVDDDGMSRNIYSCAVYLNIYNQAIEVNSLLQTNDVVKFLADNRRFETEQEEKLTVKEKKFLEGLIDVQKNLRRYANNHENPNVVLLSKRLRSMLQDGREESRAIVFVKARATCKGLATFLENDLKDIVRTHALYGKQKSGNDEGMTQAVQDETVQNFRDGVYKVLVATSVGMEGIDIPACNMALNYNFIGNEITKVQMRGRIRTQDGTNLTFVHAKDLDKERNCACKEVMMLRAMKLFDEERYDKVREKIEQYQRKEIEEVRSKKEDEMLKRRKKSTDKDYKILCRRCNAFACKTSDIRKIRVQHIVIDKQFADRIITKPHTKPKKFEGFNNNRKMFCKECPLDWGIVAEKDGMDCRILKLANVKFLNMNNQIVTTYKKWIEVPYDIPEISADYLPRLLGE